MRGSGTCPECNISLRRTNFRLQFFEDATIEKEIEIRKRVLEQEWDLGPDGMAIIQDRKAVERLHPLKLGPQRVVAGAARCQERGALVLRQLQELIEHALHLGKGQRCGGRSVAFGLCHESRGGRR